jgi:PST family polysaccharide transporter
VLLMTQQPDSPNPAGDPTTPGTSPAQPESALAQRAVRSGLWVTLSSYWMIGFGFAINIVLTRLLDETVYGAFVLALFVAQLLRLQTKFGIGFAFVNHRQTDGTALGTYAALELVIIAAGLLIGVTLPLLAAPLVVPLFLSLGYTQSQVDIVILTSVVLAFAVGLLSLWEMGARLLEKELLFGQLSLLQAICAPLSYIPAVWLALQGGGIWSLVAQMFTYYVLLVLGVAWLLRSSLPHIWRLHWHFDLAMARQFVQFGFTVGLGIQATLLLTQLDDVYIGVLVGLGTLGFYDRAYRIAQWPGLLLNSLITRAAFYTYAQVQDNSARLQQTVSMMLWLITSFAIPLTLAIFIAAPDLVRLLYGERWMPAATFLRFLVIFSAIRPLWENASQLFVAIGKPRLSLLLMGTQVAVLALAGLPLTLFHGELGTIGAVALAFATGLVLIYHYTRREVSIHLGHTLLVPLLSAGLTLAGYVVLSRLSGLNDLPLLLRVVIKSGYAFVASYGLLFLLQPRSTTARLQFLWRLARGRNVTVQDAAPL